MYGDFRENLLEILAVVIFSRPISSVRGMCQNWRNRWCVDTCMTWLIHRKLCDVRHINDSFNESCRTYEWVMAHIRMRHVKYINKSCMKYTHLRLLQWVKFHFSHKLEWVYIACEWVMATYAWVISNKMNESCHTCASVMSHAWMRTWHIISHITQEWVMAHMCMSHIT